ncbi:putative selenate reductase subunit YgfK [Dendrosporobacter sp. 1207_IL3150]|uniref:putative selenate reductase subunit YgfK n=1 Tax=Dendrosporobacter sp. 1207_IL3150 TaxID=3084054 RepID=UPI002FDB8E2F
MGDIMRPLPFREIIARMFQEFSVQRSIFSLPESSFFRKKSAKTVNFFGECCETPVGPAAGPHTQLAQNIITAYLAGSRFMELKTVQEHEPPLEKPCIDAEDEGFNTEWSSEYKVEKAYDEYIKAWILLHLLEEVFELKTGAQRSFIFNMSVGYNMQGIKSPRMDSYINNLMDASKHPSFKNYLNELSLVLKDGSLLTKNGLGHRLPHVKDLPDRISPAVCKSVTLSTMHGCPPAEIEKICAYLLTDKKLETYVKLNPTLLSYQTVRQILDNLNFDYIRLSEESFAHDLQYKDAIPLLTRLKELAKNNNRFFGVKLTNTLGTVNFKNRLPGGEMYMSGRALFPLAINVAAKICQEFKGELPISFSAGISEHNVGEVFSSGIKPITLATELLKPGGYNRLSAISTKLEDMDGWDKKEIDVQKVTALAEKSLTVNYANKYYRGTNSVNIPGNLPLFDCAEAPCKIACPINQDIPEYIKLVAEERYAEALALIYEKNALPSITSHICDHACQYNCTRMDYEGCILIREVKRIAFKKGFAEYKKRYAFPNCKNNIKAAIIGAGPAGLSAAFFLAREGFSVTVFDNKSAAGGTVRHIIPRFRISDEEIDNDVNFIKEHGVEFVFNCQPDITPSLLQEQGYKYVIAAIGAGAEKSFKVLENTHAPRVISALEFLEQYNSQPDNLSLGEHVAVIGAGNTAMDASRTALRVPGVKTSSIIYRRTEKEMPAYREEYELALADNVKFHFLLNPESFANDNTLMCRIMKLGQPDSSGRRKPEATDQLQNIKVDTVITAIGEDVNYKEVNRLGLQPDQFNQSNNVFLVGDACSGPSSIVKCIADGRKAADAICLSENSSWQRKIFTPKKATAEQHRQIDQKKLGLSWQSDVPVEGCATVDTAVGQHEFQRCLECNYVCNKCVEVCPNRANIAIPIESFRNHYQIVHLDAYCNECGNCATFCPWDGKPYTDKITVFSTKADFDNSSNYGFFLEGDLVQIRFNKEIYEINLTETAVSSASDELREMLLVLNELRTKRPSIFGPVYE